MASNSFGDKHRNRGRFNRGNQRRNDEMDGPKQKHPPGLRGKDIGLFYAKRSKEKAEEHLKKTMERDISIPIEKIREIRKFLRNCSYLSEIDESLETDSHSTRQFRLDFARVTNIEMEEQIDIALGVQAMDETPVSSVETLEKLHEDYCQTKDSRPLQEFRMKLPCWSKQQLIVETIRQNSVVLIKGETGCGKTTQVTQFILDDALQRKEHCKIVCTQPRRISAITISERVAAERNESLGKSVGYHIRLESKLPRKEGGSILYCTTGCVLKFLESDPALLNATHIILDEIHERDSFSDILMSILKIICKYRKSLKVILMSATLNADTFAKYFNNCPVIEVEGFTFPVEEFYLEDVLHMLNYTNFEEPRRNVRQKFGGRNKKDPSEELQQLLSPHVRHLRQKYGPRVVQAMMNPVSESSNLEFIEELIFYISNKLADGAILVFLPGYSQISALCKNLQKSSRFPGHRYLIFPLHSLMTGADQKRVFERPPKGVRKIIVATNIAETSITIDDIVYVINAGKRKLTNYDSETNIQVLEEMWVSKANAKQRKGRAGRCQSGICYHLYSRAREESLDVDIVPEIQRIRLDEVILHLKLLGIQDVKYFLKNLLSAPEPSIVDYSIKLLKRIETLTPGEKLTPLGYHLARLPVDPQSGKMILFGALFSCLDPITSIAASLSFRDAFYSVIGKERELDRIKLEFAENTKSDHLMLANVIKRYREIDEKDKRFFLYENFLSRHTIMQLENMKQQFTTLLFDAKFIESKNPVNKAINKYSDNLKVVKAVVCSGLYPNIAKLMRVKTRRKQADATPFLRTEEDGNCSIHLSSVNARQSSFDSRYFVYHMKQKSSKIFIFDCTPVNPYSILFFGDMIEPNFDEEVISVAGYMDFKCNEETQQLLIDLRAGLDQLLKKKIWTPAPLNWNSDEGELLRAIIQLIMIDGDNQYCDDFEELYDD